jgi:hypothetical protein
MVNVKQSFEQYLLETLGISVSLKKWNISKGLPFFLQDTYEFFVVKILETECVVMACRHNEEPTPATIRKHLDVVKEKWEGEVIFLASTVRSYNRKRLIEQKTPFVVPGNQMYLPDLRIDLREHFRKIRARDVLFSPSTQILVLRALIKGTESEGTPAQLAKQLGYASMTLTRALNELESAGVGEIAKVGRERILRFQMNKKQLWEKTHPFLRSPAQKSIWIRSRRNDWPVAEAGLSALSRYSMLAAPEQPIFAIGAADWKRVRKDREYVELPAADRDACLLEIWSYPPLLLAENGTVDRFSLFLSLRDRTDERIESALQEMLGEIQW